MTWAAVALLFTDIEGSTRMLDRLGDRYRDLLREHHRVMRRAIASSGGREVDTAGDSFFAVFSEPDAAVACALEAQRELAGAQWPADESPRVRMGIHAGTPAAEDGAFVGIDVHRAARVMAIAHGGQVLVTDDAVRALQLPTELLDLGHHRLKNLPAPEHLFQVLAPGLERNFPRLRSLNRSNLPAPSTDLIGRREDTERALELLARRDVRLLSLLGTGGTGKTRLAVEVAAEAVGRYRDGVWFVALAAIPDRALMVSEMARVLEVDPAEGRPLEDTLIAVLSERELLLVLDNFEHLAAEAGIVADLLAAAPRVDVLATSRQPLSVRGEQRMEVPPLTVTDAAELLVARARSVRSEITIEDADRVSIERICSRLDGLPLAVELAAARLAVFGPRALEARLAERLALPAGPRDLPERQQTLRATIDWSYQMLEPPEQELFASMAPFVGGVRADSAEAIWGGYAVDRLISLGEKSLLRRREDLDGEPRFWMLETIREFSLELAAAQGTDEDAAARHADHFLALTDEAEPHLIGSDQRHWLNRLEQDHLNLRSALDVLTDRDPCKAVRMAGNLTWFWTIRGYAPEAWSRLTRVLAVAPADAPGRGLAVYGASDMAFQLHELAASDQLLRQAVQLARAEGNERLACVALSHLAATSGRLGDHASMRALHEEAIAAARAAGDDWAIAIALYNYAVEPSLRGDPRLVSSLEDALAAARPTGDLFVIAIIAGGIAELEFDADHVERAETMSAEALEMAREIGFRGLVCNLLVVRAQISLQREDPEAARTQLAEAVATGSPYDLEGAALLLSTAGALAATAQDPIAAANLWAAAQHARTRISLDEPATARRLRERWQPQALAALRNQSTWDSAWKAGQALSLDDALAYAASAVSRVSRSRS